MGGPSSAVNWVKEAAGRASTQRSQVSRGDMSTCSMFHVGAPLGVELQEMLKFAAINLLLEENILNPGVRHT